MNICKLNKVRYKDYETAAEAVDFMNSRTVGTKKPQVRTFYCQMCKGYHLTSQEKDYKTEDKGEARKKSAASRVADWLSSIFK